MTVIAPIGLDTGR